MFLEKLEVKRRVCEEVWTESGVFQQQGKGARNYFQIKFGREEKAVTFALRNRRKADVLRQVR